MIKYVENSDKSEFVIATEKGMKYSLEQCNSDKKFYFPADHLECFNMKMTTLGTLLNALENLEHEISVDEEIREKALAALERMLAIKV